MRNREDKKCKKGQESTIGKIIYGFLLFMPLLAIGVTCGYAMFNKNAYQNWSGNDDATYSITDITTPENLELGENYHFYSNNNFNFVNSIGGGENRIYFENYKPYNSTINLPHRDDLTSFTLYRVDANTPTSYRFIMYANSTQVINIVITSSDLVNFSFNYVGNNLPEENNFITQSTIIQKWTFNDETRLDNAFYYAVDKVTESPLFNWAENSIIYTTTNNTCNALSITTPFIPLLLAYWLIISVIYFLYDIALMLVWIIHRKIHEMQESI